MEVAHPLVQVLARDVPGDLEEDLENRFALLGVLELMVFEIAGERPVFDVVRHRTDGNGRTRPKQIARAICDYCPRGSPRNRLRLWRAAALSQSSATARSNARSASPRRPE